MATKAPQRVLDLVARFAEHVAAYHAGRYNETQLRREFIDPLFKALGWDVDNTKGYAEAYKDVIHEDAITVGGAPGAPDYCFRIGGVRKFFVEAKKPSVDIKGAPGPAFQLRRYAWSAKLPLSILTDFEELAVYDCRVRPAKTDKPSKARTLVIRYDELPERWDELASIFARDAILKGSFDKYAESAKRKRGTAEVDEAFLSEMESWRDELARNIALRNRGLSQRDLNFAVQRTIDRIVFLRISEDRGIEPYGTLQGLVNGENVYRRLFERFERADERYNSGLFHFSDEKDRPEGPDELTPSLAIDDKVLKGILGRLYYPESPYEFSVLPADILGQVYERFLGKVIRLTKGHRAKVEEKPEVRKAGGVYYTPTYIVDYIVEHTVGELVEEKTPQEVGGLTKTFRRSKAKGVRPLAVLDPACGSGSFLLGAYQFLLTWYRDRYVEDGPEKHAGGKSPRLYQHASGEWRLTTAERKRILLSHIHGVDIDSQAVEVTKLSLLLKVLEGESDETIGANLRLLHERALPDLAANIKCGNSLIGPDFYEGRQLVMFDEEERLRINAFDWAAEFPEIMKSGGFDAVIGNPPYIRIQTMRETAPGTVDYYGKHYVASGGGNYDIYVLFVERGLKLLGHSGRMGFILPHKFFNAKYGRPLRKHVAEGANLAGIVHFGHHQVFAAGTTYTCLLFLAGSSCPKVDYTEVHDLDAWRLRLTGERASLDAAYFGADNWNIATGRRRALIDRLASTPLRLADVSTRIFQGFKTGADSAFILERLPEPGYYRSRALKSEVQIEDAMLRPLYKSGDMKRYYLHENSRVVIFPYAGGDLVSWDEIEERAPRTAEYLTRCKPLLDRREQGRWSGPQWYRYSRQQALQVMASAKILTAEINPAASFCVDVDGKACFPGGAAGGYGIVVPKDEALYFLGLLNSRCVDFYASHVATVFRGGWRSYDAKVLRQLPIAVPAANDRAAKQRKEEVTTLVRQVLDLHNQRAAAKTALAKTSIERQIAATDRQIDRLVYDLYGLTDEQVAIVEESLA